MTDEQREQFYPSLAEIYALLRRLEFPAIGRLTRSSKGEFEVRKPPTSICFNSTHLEGARPFEIMADHLDENGTIASAAAYASTLQRHAQRRAAMEINYDIDTGDDKWEDKCYHDHIFREYSADWISSRCGDNNGGPFVLTHGDLGPHNILVDESYNIACVLDWEWSRVVPLPFSLPPLWIPGYPTQTLCDRLGYLYLSMELNELYKHITTYEEDKYGNVTLVEEWKRYYEDGGFLVADALEEWTLADWFAYRFINSKVYGGVEDLPGRVREFIGDPSRMKTLEDERRKGSLPWVENDLDPPALGSCDNDTAVNNPPPKADAPSKDNRVSRWSFPSQSARERGCPTTSASHDHGNYSGTPYS